MTAPLCACGAVLPQGHPKSVVTCPGCGARSLPHEAPAVPGSPEWDRLQAKYGDPEREEWAERMAQQIAAAHAAGVAEERARVLAILDANDEFDAYGIKASIRDAIEKGAVKG